MREILFRGKTKKGEWHYGYYVDMAGFMEGSYIYSIEDTVYRKVTTGTVGQYTGLTDKNGKKIFEGDIIGWNDGELDETGKPYEDEISEIVFCEDRKALIQRFQSGFEDTLEGLNREFIRVLGNIHDNPELLKGGAE